MTPQQPAPEGQTLGAIVPQLTQQLPELIRSEMRLARAEIAEKGNQAGVGLGTFSVAGLLAFFGLAALITTVVLALALVVDAWLATLVVGLTLLAFTAVVGLAGENKIADVGPPKTERALGGIREDIATVQGQHHD